MTESERLRSLIDRSALLRQLDSKPKDRETLRTTVDLSSSTIDRAVSELEAIGYIEQIDDRYRTTLTGRLALESYDRFTTTMDGIRESIDLLGALESDAPLAPSVLANAAVIRATHDSPCAPTNHAIFDGAERIRIILSRITPEHIDTCHEQVMNGTDISLVASTSLIERLISDHSDSLTEMIDTGRVDLRQATDEAPFGLAIVESRAETTVVLRVYGAEGLRGILVNDTPKATVWANEQYATVWNNALAVQTPI